MNSSASYWVEGSDSQIRIYDDIRLGIVAIDPHGRVLWRGRLTDSVEEGFSLPVGDAVSTLVGRFPRSGPAIAPGMRVPDPETLEAGLPEGEALPAEGPIPCPPESVGCLLADR
jgi:hypothetical protein